MKLKVVAWRIANTHSRQKSPNNETFAPYFALPE